MTDIMAEFKNRRFIVAPNYLLEDRSEHVIILSDISFWAEHYDQLQAWCEQHDAAVQGLGVTLPDSETVTLFCLTWS